MTSTPPDSPDDLIDLDGEGDGSGEAADLAADIAGASGVEVDLDDAGDASDDAAALAGDIAKTVQEAHDLDADVGGPSDGGLRVVREFFNTLMKALRAFQLYDENNPVYQRFIESLRQSFKTMWVEVDGLHCRISEQRITWMEEEVYTGASRSDSLAFLFYKDGIRDISFEPGIEDGEVEPLLKVLKKARAMRGGEGDDLLTILWEADLQCFKYGYVDMMAQGLVLPEADPESLNMDFSAVVEAETDEVEEGEVGEDGEDDDDGPQTVDKDDFNPTLYSLDPSEQQELEREIELEMGRNLRRDVLLALFDRLEEPDPERQAEIMGVLRTLLPNFLSRGHLRAATGVLTELRKLGAKEDLAALQPEVDSIRDELSAPETVEELIQALEDGTLSPNAQELGAFLRHLRGGALGSLLRASELTPSKELQPVLREAVASVAEEHVDAVTDLLGSSDPVVLAGACRLAARIKIEGAAPALAGLLAHEVADVRLAAVEAAIDLRASTAAEALMDTLTDSDRDVRVAAARALGELSYSPAAGYFKQILSGKDIRQADITEKVSFFEGYGRLGGEGAVDFLSKLLNGRGFLGRKASPEIRAAAALGLGQITAEEATAALEKAQSEQDPVVRSAVGRALRSETES